MSQTGVSTRPNIVRYVVPSPAALQHLNRAGFAKSPHVVLKAWESGQPLISPYRVPAPQGERTQMRVWANLRMSLDRAEPYVVLPWRGEGDFCLLYFFSDRSGEFAEGDWRFTVVYGREGFRPYRIDSPLQAWAVEAWACQTGLLADPPDLLRIEPAGLVGLGERGKKLVLPLLPINLGKFTVAKLEKESTAVVSPFNAGVSRSGAPLPLLPLTRNGVAPKDLESADVRDLRPSLFRRVLWPVNFLELEMARIMHGEGEGSELQIDVRVGLEGEGRFLLGRFFENSQGIWQRENHSDWILGRRKKAPDFYAFTSLRYDDWEGLGRTLFRIKNKARTIPKEFREALLIGSDGTIYAILGERDGSPCLWGWDREADAPFALLDLLVSR